jgi:hypothetical protein
MVMAMEVNFQTVFWGKPLALLLQKNIKFNM